MLADIIFGICELALDPFGEIILELGCAVFTDVFDLGAVPDPELERAAASKEEIPLEPPSALLSGTYLEIR